MSQGRNVPPGYNNGSTELCVDTAMQHQAKEEVILLLGMIKTDKQGKRDWC